MNVCKMLKSTANVLYVNIRGEKLISLTKKGFELFHWSKEITNRSFDMMLNCECVICGFSRRKLGFMAHNFERKIFSVSLPIMNVCKMLKSTANVLYVGFRGENLVLCLITLKEKYSESLCLSRMCVRCSSQLRMCYMWFFEEKK